MLKKGSWSDYNELGQEENNEQCGNGRSLLWRLDQSILKWFENMEGMDKGRLSIRKYRWMVSEGEVGLKRNGLSELKSSSSRVV